MYCVRYASVCAGKKHADGHDDKAHTIHGGKYSKKCCINRSGRDGYRRELVFLRRSVKKKSIRKAAENQYKALFYSGLKS